MICSACAGTGEGHDGEGGWTGKKCGWCGGTGEETPRASDYDSFVADNFSDDMEDD